MYSFTFRVCYFQGLWLSLNEIFLEGYFLCSRCIYGNSNMFVKAQWKYFLDVETWIIYNKDNGPQFVWCAWMCLFLRIITINFVFYSNIQDQRSQRAIIFKEGVVGWCRNQRKRAKMSITRDKSGEKIEIGKLMNVSKLCFRRFWLVR